ncbi:hypothetical protein FQN50_006409 [Emmonsiellopsis sp. PD_5]|nr:hypothetical protein FQN50_006409 [Emmonsiellopsis sp. PD_5]
MPSLTSIPLEIFDIIAAGLSKRDFINLSTVCRRLRYNTIPWMFRHVRIGSSPDELVRIQQLSTSPFAEYVRTVCYHVEIPVRDPLRYKRALKRMSASLRKLQRLVGIRRGRNSPVTIESSLANSLAGFPHLQLCKFEYGELEIRTESYRDEKPLTTHGHKVLRAIGLLQDMTPHREPPEIVFRCLETTPFDYLRYNLYTDSIYLDLFRHNLRGIKSLHIQNDNILLQSIACKVCLPLLATFKVTGSVEPIKAMLQPIDLPAFAAFSKRHAKTLKTLHVFGYFWSYKDQLYALGDSDAYEALQHRLSNDKAWRSSALEEVIFKQPPDDSRNSRLEQLLLGSVNSGMNGAE